MRSIFKSVFKVSFSNIISLLSGILVGFVIPKIMGIVGYADYKTYTLYLSYIPLLSLGLGDGLYLKFSGTDRDKLNENQIRYYLHRYYLQLVIIFWPALFASLFIVSDDFKFVCVALSFTILSSQITAVHQNLSVLTSRFNEYSTRVITKALLTALFVILLLIKYRLTGTEISYQEYIIGILMIDFVLAGWYIYTYKKFNFGLVDRQRVDLHSYSHILSLGFPLLVSNMAGSIFLNLDRQFVSVLFSKEEYAVYAFAYNMLTLITTMTSAVSLVLFPALKKNANLNVGETLEKYVGPFNMCVGFFLTCYFPLNWFIPLFLPKYYNSLEIFRVVLPGLIVSTSVSVIFVNFYKLENKVKLYFLLTMFAIIFSGASNFIAYKCFQSYIAISWASILSLFVWYFVTILYFKKKYSIRIVKNVFYMIVTGGCFYLITGVFNSYLLGAVLYLIVYCMSSFFFYKREITLLFYNR